MDSYVQASPEMSDLVQARGIHRSLWCELRSIVLLEGSKLWPKFSLRWSWVGDKQCLFLPHMMFRTEIDQSLFYYLLYFRKSVFSVLRSLRVSFMPFIKERLCLDIVRADSCPCGSFSISTQFLWRTIRFLVLSVCRAHLPLAQFGHTVTVLVSDVWHYKIF